VKASKSIAQRSELGVPAAHLKVLLGIVSDFPRNRRSKETYASLDSVHYVPAATFYTLTSICDENGQFGVFIENLFDSTIVAARLALWARILCQISIILIVAAVVMNYAMVVVVVAIGGWCLRGLEALIFPSGRRRRVDGR
jgi:hypothetical protein